MKKGKFTVSLLFAVTLMVSTVSASVDTVIITGQTVGITLNSEGAMVAEIAEIKTKDGKTVSPAKDGGVKKGDVITSVNGKSVHGVDDLHDAVSSAEDKSVLVELMRDGTKIRTTLKPALAEDGSYRLGIWAKDAAAGIGTLTFYDPETGNFGALGHGIADSASGFLMDIEDGEVLSSTIVSVEKGAKGEPGELKGVFGEGDTALGIIKKNTECGIFGNMTLPEDKVKEGQSIKIGTRDDVREGKAYILANIEGSKTEKYEIEIVSIPVFTGDITKGMVIKITDKDLLSKTGGIVRGMSGSPIVQSGRLVGAVTHVFVNDPTSGYGIFIEDMLSEAQS